MRASGGGPNQAFVFCTLYPIPEAAEGGSIGLAFHYTEHEG